VRRLWSPPRYLPGLQQMEMQSSSWPSMVEHRFRSHRWLLMAEHRYQSRRWLTGEP
jgi:hypothetical protein